MTIDIEKLRALAEKATPGPWQWFGNTKMNEVYLATVNRGRRFVMDFVRWGMGGAQPRFQVSIDGRDEAGGVMRSLAQLAEGDENAAGRLPPLGPKFEASHRKQFTGIGHADAAFIAAANPAAVLALLDEVARLTVCLVKANSQAEHFERQWYLVSDGLDSAKADIAHVTALAEEACAIAERRGAALAYIERKVDGYETTFDCADEIEHGLVDARGSARIEGAVSASNNADRIAVIRAELGRET